MAVQAEEVEWLLRNLKSDTATGPDEISELARTSKTSLPHD